MRSPVALIGALVLCGVLAVILLDRDAPDMTVASLSSETMLERCLSTTKDNHLHCATLDRPQAPIYTVEVWYRGRVHPLTVDEACYERAGNLQGTVLTSPCFVLGWSAGFENAGGLPALADLLEGANP
jgi:hypothetical protein